jgi:hypothetical protein
VAPPRAISKGSIKRSTSCACRLLAPSHDRSPTSARNKAKTYHTEMGVSTAYNGARYIKMHTCWWWPTLTQQRPTELEMNSTLEPANINHPYFVSDPCTFPFVYERNTRNPRDNARPSLPHRRPHTHTETFSVTSRGPQGVPVLFKGQGGDGIV